MALTSWPAHRIEDIEADLLLAALRERYGYDFSGYACASLKRRLRQVAACFAVARLSELVPQLLYDERIAQAIVNCISVPVSEFFRDPAVWRYVRQHIVPHLESFPRINIWQIGCGHGQETYSLVILLHECGLLPRVRMVTTDINTSLLDTARAGRWPAQVLDDARRNYREAGGIARFDDYIEHWGEEIAIRPALRACIEFVEHNLVCDDAFMETQWIICRNVLIYFGEDLQRRALALFVRSLERGGYLLLGSAESLLDLDAREGWLETVHGEYRLFRKQAGGGRRV